MREVHLVCRRNLLEHDFYRRWVAGDLTIEELRDYASQYAHIVAALPTWLRLAAKRIPLHRKRLERHAFEEDDHIDLWHLFATAVGVTERELADTPPNDATAKLIRLGNTLSAQVTGSAVAWAIEVQAPAVSGEKLRGLEAHYGIDTLGGGAYFDLHRWRDLWHSAELERVLATLDPVHQYSAQRTADSIFDGLWDLLTSVDRAA